MGSGCPEVWYFILPRPGGQIRAGPFPACSGFFLTSREELKFWRVNATQIARWLLGTRGALLQEAAFFSQGPLVL